MQRSACKAFNDSYNKFKSAQDNTNKKKAETIFEIASNKAVNKQDGEKYVGPVIKKSNGFLAAVGGYNVNSYDILTNVAKGKAYLTSPCVTIDGSSVILSTNNCSLPGKCNPPNSSYGIFEGPYLQNSMDVSGCLSSQTKQFTNYDPSNILQAANTAYSYTQLANSNDLQNFKLGAICLNTVSTAALCQFSIELAGTTPTTIVSGDYTILSWDGNANPSTTLTISINSGDATCTLPCFYALIGGGGAGGGCNGLGAPEFQAKGGGGGGGGEVITGSIDLLAATYPIDPGSRGQPHPTPTSQLRQMVEMVEIQTLERVLL